MKQTLSVIIPNYNKSNFLFACVESVENQTLVPNEIIIVDDCSTDNSREIIKDLEKKYSNIKCCFLSKNAGVSNARNIGLNIASSKYVTFIDSDDIYINPNKLKNEMDNIVSSHEKHIVSYSVTITIDSNGRILNNSRNKKWKKSEFVFGHSFITVVSMLKQARVPRDYCLEKEFLQSVGAYCYKEDFYEDLDLIMRLAQNGAYFICTYKSGTGYRQTIGGLSSKSSKQHRIARRQIRKTYLNKMNFFQKVLCEFLYFINLIYKVFTDLIFVLKKKKTN